MNTLPLLFGEGQSFSVVFLSLKSDERFVVMRNPMHRFLPFIVCLLLPGCAEPETPMLHLTMKRDDGSSSVSKFRVFRTGLISDSGDGGSNGAGVRQSVTIDKIADDGVTLTVTLMFDTPDASADESKKQIVVPYDTEITAVDLKDTTLIVRLERKKKK